MTTQKAVKVEKVVLEGRQTVQPKKEDLKMDAKKVAEKKVNGKAEVKAEVKPTKEEGWSRYHHRIGSMSSVIDDLVFKGTALENAVKILMKEFKRDERLAKNKFIKHVRYLPKHRGITVNVKDDFYIAAKGGKK